MQTTITHTQKKEQKTKQLATITTTKTKQQKISNLDDFPASIPLKEDIGKSGLMWPRGNVATSHPAAKMLQEYSNKGCPVIIDKPWTKQHIIQALQRGPHISAKQKDAKKYLAQETDMKIKQGYMTKTTWGNIKDNIPINLKISPLAMIPHKSRSYRCILDLSFQLKSKNTTYESVNSATKIQAPQKSMAQLGTVIRRIIYTMANNHNKKHPFCFSKCDIKDGFWRMVVHLLDAWNFSYVLPQINNNKPNLDDIEIAVPHALQMGWSESPPYFCAATETGRDVIQQFYTKHEVIPPHPLEKYLTTQILYKPERRQPTNQVTNFEVYVDDYITYTNNTSHKHITKIARAMLHGIHSIFPPPKISGHNGEDPISQKKLNEGEGMFDYNKEILGWEINGKNFTIQLTTQKANKIIQILKETTKRKTIPHKNLQKIQGKLIHASIGLPNSRGLLSPLYKAVKNNQDPTNINQNLKQCFKDCKTILQQMTTRPTSVLELVPRDPHYIAYVDASGIGAGGVWTPGKKPIQPTVWQFKWPTEIKNKLVSTENPQGNISINDLETAAILIAWLILEKITPTPLKHSHIGIHSDNNSAVNWIQKKSTSTSTIAGHLLRAIALRQHIHQAAPLQVIHIAGENNNMADVASRNFINSTNSNTNTDSLYLILLISVEII